MIDGGFCIGCRRSGDCEHGKDAYISKQLFVLVMGFADEPGMTDRIEGRVFDLRSGTERGGCTLIATERR